jgi:hypothetical protein
MDTRTIRIYIECQPRPTEMFEIVVARSDVAQILDTGNEARLFIPALQSEQHQRCRCRYGFEGYAENATIAVINAALLQNAVTEQLQTFLDARMPSLPDAPQRQACPRRRFDPREIALGPRPTDQAIIDVANVLIFVIRLPSLT